MSYEAPAYRPNPLEMEDARDREDRAARRRGRLTNAFMDIFPKVIDCIMAAAGPILVLLAWALFGGIVYIYFFHLLPMLQLTSTSVPGCFVTGPGLWILFNLLYNHWMAIFTPPGGIPASVPVPPDIDDLLAMEAAHNVRKGEGFGVYCRYCRKPKPIRAHHCHICKKCVLKMDHHCPWVANCVGHSNYKYFFLFLFYLCIGCLFVTMLSAPPFIWPESLTTPALKRAHENGAFFALILCSTASFAVGAMGGLHLYLILTNQSTIELYFNRQQTRRAKARGEIYHNPFDLGRKKNFESVFGTSSDPRFRYVAWLCPFRPPPGNGLEYETRDDDDDPYCDAAAAAGGVHDDPRIVGGAANSILQRHAPNAYDDPVAAQPHSLAHTQSDITGSAMQLASPQAPIHEPHYGVSGASGGGETIDFGDAVERLPLIGESNVPPS